MADHPFVNELELDEVLLWHGRPNRLAYRKMSQSHFKKWFIGGPILCYVVVLPFAIIEHNFKSLLLPTLVAVVALTLGGFCQLIAPGIPAISYGITNKRLLFHTPGAEDGGPFSSRPLSLIKKIQVKKSTDGIGTIEFIRSRVTFAGHASFMFVEDVDNVYKIASQAYQEALNQPSYLKKQ